MRDPDAGCQTLDVHRLYPLVFSFLCLVVLLTFMVVPVSSPQTHNSIPRAATALPERTRHPMLGIDYVGTYWLVADGAWERLAPDQLSHRIAEVFAARDERVLFISAAPRIEYGAILDIVAAARAAEVTRISLLANCPPGRESLLEHCRP